MDKQLSHRVSVGEVLTVDAERAAVIIGKGFAVEIAEEIAHTPKAERKHTPKAKKK